MADNDHEIMFNKKRIMVYVSATGHHLLQPQLQERRQLVVNSVYTNVKYVV